MEQKSLFTFEIDPALGGQTEDLTPILTYDNDNEENADRVLKVRLDKWLWAARFFKTRALARAAIENGKVFYDGQKVMPSKEIELDAKLIIIQGRNKKAVVIRGLSTRRRSSDEADALYEDITGLYTEPRIECDDEQGFNSVDPNGRDNKPRKMVRFLRRNMGAGDSIHGNRGLEHKDTLE